KGDGADSGWSEPQAQCGGDEDGDEEGECDAGGAGECGGGSLVEEGTEVELGSDEEEKEDEADGGEGFEWCQRRWWEESSGEMGGERREEGGAEEDSADDLADDAGLPEAAGKRAAEQGDEKDGGDLEKEKGHGREAASGCERLRRARRMITASVTRRMRPGKSMRVPSAAGQGRRKARRQSRVGGMRPPKEEMGAAPRAKPGV